MVYHNPYVTGQYNPLYNQPTRVFFVAHVSIKHYSEYVSTRGWLVGNDIHRLKRYTLNNQGFFHCTKRSSKQWCCTSCYPPKFNAWFHLKMENWKS